MIEMKRLAITPPRLAVATVIIGVAASGAVWIATYRQAHAWVGPMLRPGLMPTTYTSPAWTTPVAALIGIAAVGVVAALVLRRR